ncbi:MAG: DUF1501 domain-containing protein [Endozoicomonas sp.]|uniref:DUF1501 domain-containing protein n=1 Tax=Endozoicomonas sp. TaxID=1892382 RepID=UPI003D9ACF5C
MKKKTVNHSRRNFLKNSGLMMAGSSLLFSGVSGSVMAAGQSTSRNKALVFIMLDGGNDSFNMLVPTSSDDYRDYQRSSGNLALEKKSLLKLPGYSDKNNKDFGLHGAMQEVQKLFDDKKLSFIANIGPMIEPVTKKSFNESTAQLPVGLMSHSDQFRHWQTSRPGESWLVWCLC